MDKPKFGLVEMYIHGEPHWVDTAIAEKGYEKYCVDLLYSNTKVVKFEDFLKGDR